MKRYFLIIICILSVLQISGQDKTKNKRNQSIPILIAFSTHSYSWPFIKSFTTPIQPGFKIGTEYLYSSKSKYLVLQTFNIGYFRNPKFLNAYYLNSYFTLRRTFSFKMFVDAKIGLGYVHKQHTREVFMLNENGEYKSCTDWGTPALEGGISFGLGYNFEINNKVVSPFIEYDWTVIYPHAKKEIPVLPHSLYHIGIRYYFSK